MPYEWTYEVAIYKQDSMTGKGSLTFTMMHVHNLHHKGVFQFTQGMIAGIVTKWVYCVVCIQG